MSVNKKSLFEAEDIVLADFAKALGHPARIAILKELAKRKECICGEIVEVLPLAQSTVSQHLQELKKVGLVRGTISGVKSCYCINWENFEKMVNLLNLAMGEITKQKLEDSCC
ncbi:MAG: metalloregulator ArsR/SmtB family transcription factor [bacterium]|nr:metalloregulator ArsR/SmtB family transcription factor [bacterium]